MKKLAKHVFENYDQVRLEANACKAVGELEKATQLEFGIVAYAHLVLGSTPKPQSMLPWQEELWLEMERLSKPVEEPKKEVVEKAPEASKKKVMRKK